MAVGYLMAVLGLCVITGADCFLEDQRVAEPPILEPPRIDATSEVPVDTTTLLEPPQIRNRNCNDTAANIVFVLDSSDSVGQQNFLVMKSFVKSLVQRLHIGVHASRVGLITFNRYPALRIHLYDYWTEASLLGAIDAVPFHGDLTFTDMALDLMRQEGFIGAQPTLPNIAIVITDGRSLHPNRTVASASKAQASNITMFAIGVGADLNMDELQAIGSKPDANHVFTVINFNALSTIVITISNATCNVKAPVGVVTPVTVTTEAPRPIDLTNSSSTSGDCNQTFADIVFLLDSSGSVGGYNFNLMKQFVMHVISALDIGENATKVGVITFHNYPVVRLSLDSYDTKHGIINAINRIPYSQGGTSTDLALDQLREIGFAGGRSDAPNIAIVITDGISGNALLTKVAAEQVKANHTTVFAIGIGDLIDRTELNNIASDPDEDYVFYVHNFTALASIVNTVATTTCAVPEKITTTPTTTPTTTTTTTTPTTTTTTPTTTTPTTTTSTTTTTTTPTTTTTTTMEPTTESPCLAKVADVMFVLDSSGSLGPDNFAKMKQFMTQTVSVFDIGTDYTRVGLITFNQHAILEFGLTKYNTSLDLDTAILNIRYLQGGTNTGEALQLLRGRGFLNDRPSQPHIAVIITDGLSADSVATIQQARLAREAGATLIAIGVGNGTDNRELENIASRNPANNGSLVFQVGDFEALQSLDSIVARVACGVSYYGNTMATATTNPPARVPPAVTVDSNCFDDIHAKCSERGRDICTDYEPWARAHCRLSCGFCHGPTTTPAPCVDHLPHCNEYGTYICTQVSLIRWTKDNCQAYCGLCGNRTRPTEPTVVTLPDIPTRQSTVTCADTISNCAEYGGESMCHNKRYTAWAKSHCAEYCGFCTKFNYIPTRTLPNFVTCPAWKLPKECHISTELSTCCPLPICPPTYMLTVDLPQP